MYIGARDTIAAHELIPNGIKKDSIKVKGFPRERKRDSLCMSTTVSGGDDGCQEQYICEMIARGITAR